MVEDAIELLLPEGDAATRGRARRVTTFLRLLATDARPARAGTVRVDLERARGELARESGRRLREAHEDLLRHHLRAVGIAGAGALADGLSIAADSFADLGAPRRAVQAAWDVLAEQRRECAGLAGVPAPGEAPDAVAARLVESAQRAGLAAERVALWRAWLVRVRAGTRAGEDALARLVAELEGPAPSADASAPDTAAPDDAGPDDGGDTGAGAGAGADPERRAADERARRATRAEAVRGVAACRLDRGAVGAAERWLVEHGAEAAPAAGGARRLLGWARLALGDVAGAERALAGAGPWRGDLPLALHELRAQRPEWAGLLSGRARVDPAGADGAAGVHDADPVDGALGADAAPDADAVGAPPPLRARAALGASCLAVFRRERGHGARCLFGDVAPGLRARWRAWCAERDGVCAVADRPEHRMVVCAESIVVHRAPGADALRGALGPDTARALAVAPVLDDEGEVAGWLHVECEHHLLPSRRRLARLARAWRAEVFGPRLAPLGVGDAEPARPADARAGAAAELVGTVAEALPELEERARPACREAFEALVAASGTKTAQRRWWGFSVEAGRPLLVAEGGGALEGLSERRGRRRALARAGACAGVVRFDEPDARLAIHGDAASGVVVPLVHDGLVRGLWAIESTRRRDFRGADRARLAAAAEPFGLRLALAQFRAWHREACGFDVTFELESPGFRAFLARLGLAGRSRSPVVLAGPPGAGKLVLARWLAFEARFRAAAAGRPDAAPAAARLRVVEAARLGAAELDALLERSAAPAAGPLVVQGVEDLDAGAQARLLAALEGVEAAAPRPAPPGGLGARLVLTARAPLARSAADERLRADLAQRLDRLQLFVPPLADRRAEIPTWVRFFARRFAAEEGVAAPELADAAVGLLWRQPWAGNLRELESLVYKLVVLRPGRSVDAAEVRAVARDFGLELAKRLPSRHPRRRDVLAALAATRKRGGAPNKCRAALYLGWDPDTLVARMRDLGVADGDVADGGVPAGAEAAAAWLDGGA